MPSKPAPAGPQSQVAPIHFEDFSGEQFERLAFAFTLRNPKLHSVEWNGQSGGDDGKDILAKDYNGDEYLFLCANYARLTFSKIESDIKKVIAARPLKLCHVTIIAGGKVSANLRKKAKNEIHKEGEDLLKAAEKTAEIKDKANSAGTTTDVPDQTKKDV